MEIPIWYTEDQLLEWLERTGYPDKNELVAYMTKHLQLAFIAGWKRALASQPEE